MCSSTSGAEVQVGVASCGTLVCLHPARETDYSGTRVRAWSVGVACSSYPPSTGAAAAVCPPPARPRGHADCRAGAEVGHTHFYPCPAPI